MINQHPGNTAFRWTDTFFQRLQQLGLQHVVISPGSRSTPLTLAAAANQLLNTHVILDERSAAFTALGIGKATNIPALLVCTSGTAVANYYPAVIEARQSGIPIILATADRPPHLRATGANQAIDQLNVFGDYSVFFHEVGEPSEELNDINRLKMLGNQAFHTSRKKRGPVHLNFPFRKPLEPNGAFLSTLKKENNATEKPTTSLNDQEKQLLTDQLSKHISEARRPLIIVGPTAPQDDTRSIGQLAQVLNCPVLSEITSCSTNNIHKFSGFLRNRDLLKDLAPDLILRFGFQPTSKALELGLQNWNTKHHYHFAPTEAWQDATFSGAEHIPWFGRSIEIDALNSSTDNQWLNKWKQAEKNYQTYYRQSIGKYNQLTDGHVYDHLTPQISENHTIMVSNSFPARDINLFGNQSPKASMFLNRGTSGIDGITSTALGISLGIKKPGVLFTGDLAFLHDSNALLNGKKAEHPLAIIVLNNSGGSIFRMLPIANYDDYFESYFETPQSVNIEQLVNSHDLPYHRVTSLPELKNIDLEQWQQKHGGVSVIECKTDTDVSMKLRKKLWDFSDGID